MLNLSLSFILSQISLLAPKYKHQAHNTTTLSLTVAPQSLFSNHHYHHSTTIASTISPRHSCFLYYYHFAVAIATILLSPPLLLLSLCHLSSPIILKTELMIDLIKALDHLLNGRTSGLLIDPHDPPLLKIEIYQSSLTRMTQHIPSFECDPT